MTADRTPPRTVTPRRSTAGRRRPSRVARLALGLLLGALPAVLVVAVPTASASSSANAAVNAVGGSEPAWLRPAHLVPGLGAMDIRLSPFSDEGGDTPQADKPLLETTAAYGAVGAYSAMPAGSYAVSVRPAGTPVSEPALLSLTVDLEAGQAYTVAGLGTKTEPRLERLVDDLTPPDAGSANVRLLPASAVAPVIDVRAEGGPVLARAAGLGRPTGYTAAPSGRWTVIASGNGASGSTDLVLDGGSVYTLLVLDSADGSLVVRPVVDAVGVATMPVGGADTGFGGLAGDAGPSVVGPAVVLSAVAVLLLVVAARRPVPVRPRGRRAVG